MFNFLLYYTSKIQHLTSNLKPNIKNLLCIYSYIRIFSNTNIRLYHIRSIFFVQIYSDIRSYRFLEINIFEYSFISKIHIRQCCVAALTYCKMCVCPHSDSDNDEAFWLPHLPTPTQVSRASTDTLFSCALLTVEAGGLWLSKQQNNQWLTNRSSLVMIPS